MVDFDGAGLILVKLSNPKQVFSFSHPHAPT
jgi:hypothetical protein